MSDTPIELRASEREPLPDDPHERLGVLLKIFDPDRDANLTLSRDHFPQVTDENWQRRVAKHREEIEHVIRVGIVARESAKLARSFGLLNNDGDTAAFLSSMLVSELRDAGRQRQTAQEIEAEGAMLTEEALPLVLADAFSNVFWNIQEEAEQAAAGFRYKTVPVLHEGPVPHTTVEPRED